MIDITQSGSMIRLRRHSHCKLPRLRDDSNQCSKANVCILERVETKEEEMVLAQAPHLNDETPGVSRT